MVGESRPVVHIHQQLGNLDARKQYTGLVDEALGCLRYGRIKRRDL